MATSKAQKKASENWNGKNKGRKNYLSWRSRAKSFIQKGATTEDLIEFKKIIEDRISKESTMKFNGKKYIKVHDGEAHEGGWAFEQDSKYILDNDLGDLKAGTVIEIDENRNIINHEKSAIEKIEREKEEKRKNDAQIAKDSIGKKVNFKNHGVGVIDGYDEKFNQVSVVFENGTHKEYYFTPKTFEGHWVD